MDSMDGSDWASGFSHFFDDACYGIGDGMSGVEELGLQNSLQGATVGGEGNASICLDLPGLDLPEYGSLHIESPAGLATFNDDDKTHGVSGTSAKHLGPWQASVENSMPSQYAELPPSELQEKHVNVTNIDEIYGFTPCETCFCILCLQWPKNISSMGIKPDDLVSCRVMGCGKSFSNLPPHHRLDYFPVGDSISHEQAHFYENRVNEHKDIILFCKQEDCKFTTKRHSDLKRHYAGKHCKNAEKFPCDVIGCRFSGDEGFSRKDKLRDHRKAMHRDITTPGKPMRTLKPKAGISKTGSHA